MLACRDCSKPHKTISVAILTFEKLCKHAIPDICETL
jgi:hypothetical protein